MWRMAVSIGSRMVLATSTSQSVANVIVKYDGLEGMVIRNKERNS